MKSSNGLESNGPKAAKAFQPLTETPALILALKILHISGCVDSIKHRPTLELTFDNVHQAKSELAGIAGKRDDEPGQAVFLGFGKTSQCAHVRQ